MATIILAVATAVLGLGLVALFAVTIEVMRRYGLLLWKVEALEEALADLSTDVAEQRLLVASFLGGPFLLTHPWLTLRPGSNDHEIVAEVIYSNCYRLPAAFSEDDVIIDIGAHVGVFAMGVLDRGCGEVHCFEPEPSNAARARRHLAPYGERVRLTESAVWRSDQLRPRLSYQQSSESRNHGGGDVLHPGGLEVAAVPIDDVLRSASHGGKRRIRLLKLDCEGSEYPILLTSQLLHLVDEIVGEIHLVPDEISAAWDFGSDFSPDILRSCLESHGFDVEWPAYGGDSRVFGTFFAHQTASKVLNSIRQSSSEGSDK